MRVDIIMPQLGESVVEGTITRWLVKPGDIVQADQPVVEVATDKADSEVPAPQAGRIEALLVADGALVKIGQVLCTIETDATAAAAAPPAAAAKPAAPAAPAAPKPASAPPPAPPKASAPAAPASPTPAAPRGADPKAAPVPRETRKSPPRDAFPGVTTSPAVRRLALEHGLDLSRIEGSGERGRITRDDALRAAGIEPDSLRAAPAPEPDPAPAPHSPPAQPQPAADTTVLAALMTPAGYAPAIPGVGYHAYKVSPYTPHDGDKVINFSRRRRLIADHMVYSKTVSPHVVTVAEIDVERTVRLREQHKAAYKAEGISLTMVAFICSAVVRALREFPGLNARVLDDAYVLLRNINLGVAVDTPEGLLVPNIKRADELSMRGLARSIGELAAKAREGKLTPDELSGSSFSVSNPGAKGNLFGAAVISQPNVGILRTGEIKKRVVVVEGEEGADTMVIHSVMYAALSYDHRIIDGVLANSFLWRVGEILRNAEFSL
ncbi:MAG: 2-oxo acid dehydrogenase subunit E2 [Deltaproteobacteria bacterium]|nr:2-oxo acid dehydrogenase subunit E2 [Deltaproteobacteria bacterium]